MAVVLSCLTATPTPTPQQTAAQPEETLLPTNGKVQYLMITATSALWVNRDDDGSRNFQMNKQITHLLIVTRKDNFFFFFYYFP